MLFRSSGALAASAIFSATSLSVSTIIALTGEEAPSFSGSRDHLEQPHLVDDLTGLAPGRGNSPSGPARVVSPLEDGFVVAGGFGIAGVTAFGFFPDLADRRNLLSK